MNHIIMQMLYMELQMNKLQELLTITMEECGELIQACSKAIRCDDYYNHKIDNCFDLKDSIYLKNYNELS